MATTKKTTTTKSTTKKSATAKKSTTQILQQSGVDTTKYFHLNADGIDIQIAISADGIPTVVDTARQSRDVFVVDDALAAKIASDGYIKNTRLHRRWIMAQMFRMLGGEGYTQNMKKLGYQYQWHMLIDEVNTIAHLQKSDKTAFKQRSRWFSPEVIMQIIDDYQLEVAKLLNKLPVRHRKGVKYQRIPGIGDVFVSDYYKKIWAPWQDVRHTVLAADGDYSVIYAALKRFYSKHSHVFVRVNGLSWKIPAMQQSRAWQEAFKGAGAYYTLDNMIKFHNCRIYQIQNGKKVQLDMQQSLTYIELQAVKFTSQHGSYACPLGYKMLGMLKEVIADNNFKFKF